MSEKIIITEVQPSFELITPEAHVKDYTKILEVAGRTCYKSEEKITEGSAERFIKMLLGREHESVIEHCSITARFIGDRSMSHQLVRHRIASYSQESQRFCNYDKKGFQVIRPPSMTDGDGAYGHWLSSVRNSCESYLSLIELGKKPEDARSVLPNAIKTEVVTTYNLRMWRHVFSDNSTGRALNPHAQWQIKGIMREGLRTLHELLPSVFEDQYQKLLELEADGK